MLSSDHTTKRCSKCGKEYPLTDEFWHRSNTHKCGYKSACKDCRKKECQEYRVNNPEKRKETLHNYYERNKDTILENNRLKYRENIKIERARRAKYRENNREKVRITNRTYNKNNHEKRLEYQRKHRHQHPNLYKNYVHKRRALRNGSNGHHTSSEVEFLFQKQSEKCFHCGCDISTYYEQDHWIPLTRGGSDLIENIRLLCRACNRSKSNKLPWEWSDRYKCT